MEPPVPSPRPHTCAHTHTDPHADPHSSTSWRRGRGRCLFKTREAESHYQQELYRACPPDRQPRRARSRPDMCLAIFILISRSGWLLIHFAGCPPGAKVEAGAQTGGEMSTWPPQHPSRHRAHRREEGRKEKSARLPSLPGHAPTRTHATGPSPPASLRSLSRAAPPFCLPGGGWGGAPDLAGDFDFWD